MGVATIVGGGPDGRYTITFDIGTVQRAARVAAVTAQLATLAPKLVAAQAAYDAAVVEVDAARAALAAAVEAYVAATPANRTTALLAHGQAVKLYAATESASASKRLRLNDLKLAKAQREKELAYWAGLTLVETREAWCIDLTEDAAGQVATAEIPGESGLILVAPGGRPYVNADGVLASRALQNPAQAFFNAAILPGWQKFMPTYRWGTITALDFDADTADVSLAAATSSAQGLNVNQATALAAVPVDYMTCNAAAFEVGDAVVVQFVGQDWAAPKVIGFLDNPRGCTLIGVSYAPAVHPASPIASLQVSLPIAGDAAQSVYLRQDADPVSAATPVLGSAWYQWSDGQTALARHDLNIEMDAPPVPAFSRTAYYVCIPLGMLLSRNLDSSTFTPPSTYTYTFTFDGFSGAYGETYVSGVLTFTKTGSTPQGPDFAVDAPEYVVSWTLLGKTFLLRYVYAGEFAGQPSYLLVEQSDYYV